MRGPRGDCAVASPPPPTVASSPQVSGNVAGSILGLLLLVSGNGRPGVLYGTAPIAGSAAGVVWWSLFQPTVRFWVPMLIGAILAPLVARVHSMRVEDY